MRVSRHDWIWTVFAGTSAVLASLADELLQKIYHGYYGLKPPELIAFAFLLPSLAFFMYSWIMRKTEGIVSLSRWWLGISLVLYVYILHGDLLLKRLGSPLCVLLLVVVLITWKFLVSRYPVEFHQRTRRVIAAVPWLIFSVPILMVNPSSDSIVWVDSFAGPETRRTGTIVLLFDEMNANASGPIVSQLKAAGLSVQSKAIDPVHSSTTEVLPAMYTKLNFQGAKVCGQTRICSNDSILDFAQISVKRHDVDVVGFHHAYCAIRGLRSCQRFTTHRKLWEIETAKCGLKKFLPTIDAVSKQDCHQVWHGSWLEMGGSISRAILNSQTLKDGGVLYAHLPFPHLPARRFGTLSEQLEQNLKLASGLIFDVLAVMEKNSVDPRILIFSDHPLRLELWCASGMADQGKGCDENKSLYRDGKVPLIIASRSQQQPTVDNIKTNKQVFDVLREWLAM